MPTKDEDLTLVSLLSAHAADALPYLRLPHFHDLFPTRRAAAEWVLKFWDQNQQLPKVALLKKHFPGVNTLQAAEPLPYCYNVLKQQYVDAVSATAGEKMTDALDKRDMVEFLKHNAALHDIISSVERPLGSVADNINNFVEQLGASLDKDSRSALRVMPTGFGPFDAEDGGGMRGGHLYVLSSLINLGKTYVSLTMANSLRAAGYRVIYTSTEMPKEDLMARATAIRFKLDVNQFIKKEQPQSSIDAGESKLDWYKGYLQMVQAKIDAAKGESGALFIRGCDDGVLTPKQIRADVKEFGADAVFIDAAQDIRDDRLTKDRTPALYNAVAELNQLIKAMNVALLVTVQLDSEVEKKGLTQGNLNRIQWAQVFAQKAHIVMTMLGSRDSHFREMTIDKTRDGQAGRKFWLTFKFPEVDIQATTKTPGNLEDLENATPAETLGELEAALNSASAPADPPETPAPARKLPTRIVQTSDSTESQDDDEAQDGLKEHLSAYERRRQQKALKKVPRRRSGT